MNAWRDAQWKEWSEWEMSSRWLKLLCKDKDTEKGGGNVWLRKRGQTGDEMRWLTGHLKPKRIDVGRRETYFSSPPLGIRITLYTSQKPTRSFILIASTRLLRLWLCSRIRFSQTVRGMLLWSLTRQYISVAQNALTTDVLLYRPSHVMKA